MRPAARKILNTKNAVAVFIVVALSVIAALAVPDSSSPGHGGPWYSILPPLLAVTLAIVTRRVMGSLALAIVIGGLLASVPSSPLAVGTWGEGLRISFQFVWGSVADWTNIQILAFVVVVLAMISTVIVAGGLQAIVLWLARFVRGPRSAQTVTALMGLTVFIDDYANTMIVGASMRPVTDRLRVSREKLAFLVDSTSAPVAGVAVVSTWVGYEVGLFEDLARSAGIESTGYAMLFAALPFRFYCILMICFVLMNALTGKDFGPMARAERRCRATGAVAEEDAVAMTSKAFSTATPAPGARARMATAILPIAALFGFLFVGIWLDGGGGRRLAESPLALLSPAAWMDVIGASENSIPLLAGAGAVSLALVVICARWLAKAPFAVIVRSVLAGARASLLPVAILVLAWSLKAACDRLGTGPFLVAAVGETLGAAWFPAITFIIAALTSFSTGTSFGTMAILIPVAGPIAFHLGGDAHGLVMMVTLAAILDGSILGDHCSPISDTTIMSSISSSCDHIHHVRTQLPYSLTVGSLALICGYLPAGFGVSPWLALPAAVAAMAVLFYFLPAGRDAAATTRS